MNKIYIAADNMQQLSDKVMRQDVSVVLVSQTKDQVVGMVIPTKGDDEVC